MSSWHKYNAKGETVDGHHFPSKKEARRYRELKLLEMAGEISGLELQPKFCLQESFKDRHGKTHKGIYYIADFKYYDSQGNAVIEDAKGVKTQVFNLKMKLFLRRYPEYDYRLT